MKTFRNLMNEVISYQTGSKKAGADMMPTEKSLVTSTKPIDPKKMGYKHIGRTSSGHDIYHTTHGVHKHGSRKGLMDNDYWFHNPKTGHIDLAIRTGSRRHKNGTQTHDVESLVSREGSKLKAHHAYAHLIRHHGMHITTQAQTLGSQAVWRRLGKMKGIGIHGWHKKEGASDVHPNREHDYEDIYHQHHEPKDKGMPEHPTHLVAFKKGG